MFSLLHLISTMYKDPLKTFIKDILNFKMSIANEL